jgi:hypothetical protein
MLIAPTDREFAASAMGTTLAPPRLVPIAPRQKQGMGWTAAIVFAIVLAAALAWMTTATDGRPM